MAEDGRSDSTLQLLGKARAGDGEAIEWLFTRHLKPLQRWAAGRLPGWARDVADTDDLVQDALLHTFTKIGRFEARGAGGLQAYLRRAILNRVRDELRRKARRPGVTDLEGLAAASADSPLEQAIGSEAAECYERALGRLTPEEREAIIARVERGCSYEELAKALGKPTPDAARKAAHRALARLAEEMKVRGARESHSRHANRRPSRAQKANRAATPTGFASPPVTAAGPPGIAATRAYQLRRAGPADVPVLPQL